MTLKEGDTVEGRYRILKALDRGGMGSVFLAEHTLIKRRVALKLLRADLAQDVDVLERFMNEARAAGTLGHPNIVESTDMGFTRDSIPYIVFELLEGSLLTDEIYRTQGMPVRRALRIARQIASALYAAHTAGVIHRDLKSDNIFLTDRDEAADHVKVIDFGVSQFMGVDEGGKRGLVVGTPQFMAPEQILTPDQVDCRVDIYALGVILYEMLAARRPYEDDKDPTVVFERILHNPPAPMGVAGLPPGLEVLLFERFITKTPEHRFPTMKDAEGALAAFAGIVRPANRDSEPIIVLPAPQRDPAELVALPRAPVRRSSGLGWLAAAVLTAAAGGVLLFRDPGPSQKQVATPDTAVVRDDAGQLSSLLENAIHGAQLRADGLAVTPMLRAAIVTDARTVDDMLKGDFALKLADGEVFEMSQLRDDRSVVLARIPHGDPLPSQPSSAPSLRAANDAVAVIVSSPVQGTDGKPAGAVTLSVPVDIAPIRTRVAAHASAAVLRGLDQDVALVKAAGSGRTADAPLQLAEPGVGSATLSEVLPLPPETESGGPTPFRYGAYGAWGGASLFALIYLTSLLRARQRD